MNAARLWLALVAGHAFVATIAWTSGYTHGRIQRRIIDLRVTPAPYDWAIDGECEHAT